MRRLLSIARPDHVVVVIEQDRASDALTNPVMPYFQQVASTGLVYTNSHGVTHPSEPNSAALLSGSTQGVTDNGRNYSFSGANVAKSFFDAGLSFSGYVESLPADGSQVTQAGDANTPDLYTRNVNPMAQFTNYGTIAGQPRPNSAVNRTFAAFSSIAGSGSFSSLPTVSYIIPNNLHSTHGSNETYPWAGSSDVQNNQLLRQMADTWLKANLDGYLQWAKTHNSLLIVTQDEEWWTGGTATTVTTMINGDPRLFVPGSNSANINHYNVLRTIEDMYGLAPLNNTASAAPLTTNAQGQLAPTGSSPTLALTTTALATSLNPSTAGQVVTFTATVTATTSGLPTPTGSIVFKDGAIVLGTVVLNSAAKATFSTGTLSAATHSITAQYLGDTQFAGSTSSALSQTVKPAPAPANDNFANRATITGTSATIMATNVGASKQSGEPKHAGDSGGKSVWWTWTAPTAGVVTIDTLGSSFDSLLAVYTGSSLTGLTSVASNDDAAGTSGGYSLLSFSAVAGTVYQIAVDGWHGASGTIVLHLSLAAAPTPPKLRTISPAETDESLPRTLIG